MPNTSLAMIVENALPALSGNSVTYNPEKNIYLTLGYTSAAGNMYYQAIRFSKRLAIYFDIGQGFKYTFLNGIKLFCWDGQKAKLIAQKNWSGCNWKIFSECFAKEQSILMLKDFLCSQAKALGNKISDTDLLTFSRQMIEETEKRCLA